MIKPIYQMRYDEFKNMCWNKWGIDVCMKYPDVLPGEKLDHRKSEIIVKIPKLSKYGEILSFLDEDMIIYWAHTLRDAIAIVSRKRKTDKEYMKQLEKEMKKICKEVN